MRDLVQKLIKQNLPIKPVTVGHRRLLDNPKDINDADFPNGWVNFYCINDYSATSYFYLDKPSTNLAELPHVKLRVE